MGDNDFGSFFKDFGPLIGIIMLSAMLGIFLPQPAQAATLTIITTSLSGGSVGQSYSQSLSATGGTSPYTWSITSGNLSGGLSLSSLGVISGTPSSQGTSTFTIEVTDSDNNTDTKELTITIVASGQRIPIDIVWS